MDEMDVRILRTLQWNPHDRSDATRAIRGVWDIARELGVHGNTVKRRLADMEQKGILEGYHLWPELGILDTVNALFAFRFPDLATKEDAYDRLMHDDGCSDLYSFVGTEAWFGLSAPTGTDLVPLAERLGKDMGATDVRYLTTRSWEAEPITDLERRVLAEFHMDALRPLAHAAEAIGVSPKTVRAKLESLARKRAVVMFPYLRMAEIDGLVPVMLEVIPEDGANVTPAVLDAFPDAVFRCLPNADVAHVALALPNTRAIANAIGQAQALPDVKEVRHHLIEDSRPCHRHDDHLRMSDYVAATVQVSA